VSLKLKKNVAQKALARNTAGKNSITLSTYVVLYRGIREVRIINTANLGVLVGALASTVVDTVTEHGLVHALLGAVTPRVSMRTLPLACKTPFNDRYRGYIPRY